MEILQTARFHYVSARKELVMRLRLRDQVLLVYLGFVGALAGVALGVQNKVEVMITIPYLALGCCILVSQHNLVIGALIRFINGELKPELEKRKAYATQFVSSRAFREHSRRSNWLRSMGHGLIILGPAIIALYANSSYASQASLSLVALWWFALFSIFLSFGIICFAHKYRMDVYRQSTW